MTWPIASPVYSTKMTEIAERISNGQTIPHIARSMRLNELSIRNHLKWEQAKKGGTAEIYPIPERFLLPNPNHPPALSAT